MKIVYCINSIRTLGGVERVTVVKANALAEIPGNEVYIAVLDDKNGEYVETPSSKVKVVDLDAVFFPKGMPGSKVSYVLQIEKKIAEYRLKLSALLHSVALLGRRSDMRQILLNGSIFAFSSSFEEFGLVLVEAMECGLPVVSTDCQYGPNEIITEGVDGFLTPVGDVEYLAKRICQLVENEELRLKMGKAAKLKACQYHPDSLALRWTKFFTDLIDE